MSRPMLSLVALLELSALAALSVGCHRHRAGERKPTLDPDLGMLGLRSPRPSELADDLAYLRARAEGKTPAIPLHATNTAGSRIFVTYHRAHLPPLTVTALGKTIGDALNEAGRPIDAHRIQIDVAQSARSFVHPTTRIGSVGVFRKGAFVLPADPLLHGWMSEADEPALSPERLDRLLAKGEGPSRLFTTISAVESAAHDGAILLLRGRPKKPVSIDPTTLRARIALGARYLARMTAEGGKLLYLYDIAGDREIEDEYSEIRHAGATDALFASYRELRDPLLYEAGKRALGWLDGRLKTIDDARAYLPDDDNPLGTIGGTGLTLIAFASHAAATGETDHLARMRQLASFLVGQIDSKGKFQAFGGVGRDVLYYPGEAMLGLLRLYAVDPDRRWLDAAEKVARWRIQTPYEGKRDWYRDYWYLLVLGELHRHTGASMWADHAASMTDAGMREQDEEEADFAATGAYDDTPRPNPTSTYCESLASSIAAARKTGRPDGPLLDHARRAATFVIWQQLDEQTAFRARDPDRAIGGVPGNPWGTYVRIDDVQHALRALLELLHA